MSAAVDDLDIIDADQWQAVGLGEEPAIGLEIADDDLRGEFPDHFEVASNIGGHALDGAQEVVSGGEALLNFIVCGGHGQTPDGVDVSKALRQKIMGAPGGDDVNVVAVSDELFEDHGASDGVAHAFANDSV